MQPQQVHKVEDKAFRFCAQVGDEIKNLKVKTWKEILATQPCPNDKWGKQ